MSFFEAAPRGRKKERKLRSGAGAKTLKMRLLLFILKERKLRSFLLHVEYVKQKYVHINCTHIRTFLLISMERRTDGRTDGERRTEMLNNLFFAPEPKTDTKKERKELYVDRRSDEWGKREREIERMSFGRFTCPTRRTFRGLVSKNEFVRSFPVQPVAVPKRCVRTQTYYICTQTRRHPCIESFHLGRFLRRPRPRRPSWPTPS